MRYFLAFLVTIGLLIILIFVLFTGGGNDKAKVPTSKKTLVSYANTDAEASLLIAGPINANSLHERILITVNSSAVTYKAFRGYDGFVTRTERFANSENAYSAFLSGLTTSGFTSQRTGTSYGDGAGTCPLGQRYTFKFVDNGKSLVNSWAGSCGGTKTFLGSLNLTISLFQLQVPDYNLLTVDLNNL